MKQKEREEIILELENKYCNLVWYARKNVDKLEKEGRFDIIQTIRKLEEKYPEETRNIKSYKNGDWEHGFNSGMLAGMRFVLSLMDRREGYEVAIEQFPFLDT